MFFMDKDEPNFIWKNHNALRDFGLIIENEIKELSPNKRYETISVLGKSGELYETFDDYDAYDLKIPNVSIPYDRLYEVKEWLSGTSQLITHNDIDKYIECTCSMNKPIEFENEIGVFYKFDITFRCQPFRRKVNKESEKLELEPNYKKYHDPGQEKPRPFIELVSNGGDVTIKLNENTLTLVDTSEGYLFVDNEKGLVVQNNKLILTKGEFLVGKPGWNEISVSNATNIIIHRKSVWL